MWEFYRICELKEPIFINSIPDKTNILLLGKHKFGSLVKKEKIQRDVPITRMFFPEAEITMVMDQNVSAPVFYLPVKPGEDIRKEIFDVFIEVFEKYGINTIQIRNDLLFEVENQLKKFSAIGHFIEGDWNIMCSMITLKFDSNLANEIYNFNEGKMKDRAITDMKKFIGGLQEVNPEISHEVVKEIAQRIAEKFELEFYEDKLTEEELDKINKLKERMDEDWVLNAKHPDFEVEKWKER